LPEPGGVVAAGRRGPPGSRSIFSVTVETDMTIRDLSSLLALVLGMLLVLAA
jgi:hypothetical protein